MTIYVYSKFQTPPGTPDSSPYPTHVLPYPGYFFLKLWEWRGEDWKSYIRNYA